MRRAQPSSNQSATWSDEAFEATEFLFADYRDFVFPAHLHETFAIGVIEAGGQRFRPGRAPALVMPAGTLCAINPGVVHQGLPATEQGWRYRMFYPSPALVASTLEHSQRAPLSGEWGLGRHVIDDRELYREFLTLHLSSQLEETLLERQTRIAYSLRRLFERHGNFSPERNQPRVAPRTVARVRDYLHSMYQHEVSIADLAQHFADGRIHVHRWPEMSDEEIIAELVEVRGIGRWTAEMFLIFNLLRPDVFPLDDLGLQKAIRISYFRKRPVSIRTMRKLGESWRPWRSVATWYLWRSLDPLPVEY